jgi:glycosyltransferase involved in cell wall biosynthesis
MKIAIEAFWLNTDKLTGVGYYQLNVIVEMLKLDSHVEFYLLYPGDKWVGPDLGNRCISVSYGIGKVTYLVNFKLHKVIKKLNPDIYHATFPTRVPPQKLRCPIVTTVHDLLGLHIENFYRKAIFNITTHCAWKKSDHFLCNSQYTADEIYNYKSIPKEKIAVTYLAPAFKVTDWNRHNKHILFVGSLTHRKNPIFLLDVYQELCKIMSKPPKLIYIGEDRGGCGEIINREACRISNGSVEWRGYVFEKELNKLYSDTAIFILPSKLEGFGMPVIEAMSSGIPVVCSDIEVFREIAEGAAEVISGWDIKEWAEKIKDILNEPNKLDALSIACKKRAEKFNWKTCGAETLKCYNKLIGID